LRFFLISTCLLLFACAAPPGTESHAYRAQPVKVAVQVDENGAFFSQTPITTVAELDRARQVAIHQLRTAAANYGYESYVISRMNIEETDQVRLVVSGRFFRRGEGTADAMPVEGLGSGVVVVAGDGFSRSGVPDGIMPEMQPDTTLSTGAIGAPRVIQAPDFRVD
jgi:hypothetical protein